MDYFPPLCMADDQFLHHIAAAGAGGDGGNGGAEVAPSCPRCASTNTKFCYYNNYSLTQPRYLCKSCRRYWTRGGSLRNVPMGGGCRKSRRSKAARAAVAKTGSFSGRSYTVEDSSSSAAADIDMATVFAKFLNQKSSSSVEDSVGRQDSDDAGFVQENDENALVFPDQEFRFEADQDGLLWSDTNSSEMSNLMTWQADSPFPSDEFWSSGFDFSGLEVLSGSPSNTEN